MKRWDEWNIFCWNGMNEYWRKIRAFLGWRNEMNEYHFLEWDETIFYISLKKFIFSFYISINLTNSIYTSNNISYFPFFITSNDHTNLNLIIINSSNFKMSITVTHTKNSRSFWNFKLDPCSGNSIDKQGLGGKVIYLLAVKLVSATTFIILVKLVS